MSFQTPITIKDALTRIQDQEYVLPAIQREFVWQPKQICSLFDSLMRGYPIGGFLFWKVLPENSKKFTWYGFLRDYHERDLRHCPVLDLSPRSLTAILDGQQRLTSLNIGLRGSHAEKEPHKRWTNSEAFLKKHLFLNLVAGAGEDQSEQGLKYDFRFMNEARAAALSDPAHVWFRVADTLNFTTSYSAQKWLRERSLGNSEVAAETLHRIYHLVHEDKLIPYFEETDQDLDRVLNIFIRVNSGGTPLSYSDLLLSIATAAWTERDARKSVHGLVDELNRVGGGFRVSQDLVLKTGLVLADIESIAFRVSNFTTETMKALDEKWDEIERALRVTVGLLSDFGFSAGNLSAHSVVIPIAYYVHRHGLTESYRSSVGKKDEREHIRRWVNRSLVKAGVWGSGLDTLLIALREALRTAEGPGFPLQAIEKAMEQRGKGLRFTKDELDDLLDSNIQNRRTFPLLALLYPYVDLRNQFHVDHVFPSARFTAARLRQVGVGDENIDAFIDRAGRLPNLQLLDGAANVSKQDKLPAVWLKGHFVNEGARKDFCDRNDLGEIPEGITDFAIFFEARRKRMLTRLAEVLGVEVPATTA